MDLIGIGMIIPIIPIIFTDPTSPSFMLAEYASNHWYIIAGLVLGFYGLMQFIAAPILGELSDMYGRKRLLTIGVGVLAISQVFFGAGILMKSLWLIFISRMIAGLGGANFSIAQASIADISEPENRAKNFGLIGVAFGLGFILGPVFGGYIAHATNSAAIPFFVAGALGIINLISVSLFLPETHHVRSEKKKIPLFKGIHNLKQALTDKDASRVYITSLLYMLGFSFFNSFSGIYFTHRYGLNEAGLGTYFGIVGIWIVITQAIILRFITKIYNEKQILRITLLSMASALLVLPFIPTLFLQYLFIPFLAIPQGLTIANINSLISRSVSKEKQGVALGINGSIGAFSQGTIPALSGLISSIFGIIFPFILGGISIFWAWYVLFIKSNRR